ncbi:MAG: M20/M25/M40 family metallo-hydrolase [Pirellulales bacterium]|nr:M20/M25/M40 family metallo-hydrolase [Pirellulales bacterium]
MDTVPACGWQDRAFHPVVQSGELIGLGSSDDKASLAAMVLALLEIVEESISPPRTIVLVCAADEEYAQTGIREFLRTTDKQFAYGIFGEPTQLNPVPQHKGIARWDITVHGRSAHSGCPELGVNAISGMVEVIRALQRRQEKLQSRPTCSLTSATTITVTKIAGGQTRNAIPEQCAIAVDVRVSPGMDSAAERETIMDELSALPWNISHSEPQLLSPPLNTDPQSSFSRDVLSICQQTIGNHAHLQGMPYGTDAAWTAGLFPSIVLGPGDIRLAHAIDERIALTEVRQAIAIYKQIMLHPFAEYIEPNRFGSDGRT